MEIIRDGLGIQVPGDQPVTSWPEVADPSILIVEDDPNLATALSLVAGVSWPGLNVVLAGHDGMAFALRGAESFDLVVVGVSTPNEASICVATVRAMTRAPLLLMATEQFLRFPDQPFFRDCDDFIARPFTRGEFVARAQRLLAMGLTAAHRDGSSEGERLRSSKNQDPTCSDSPAGTHPLTPVQTKLLDTLVEYAGAIVPTSVLAERIWGGGPGIETTYPNVRWHVSKLRKVLSTFAQRQHDIVNVRGQGYRYDAPINCRNEVDPLGWRS